ncbi:MAG: hypothetical protein WDZ37_02270 [Solirubrobacterales bacterium]
MLGLLALAEAWFIAAPRLDDLGGSNLAFFATTVPAMLLATGLVIGCLPFRDDVAAQLGLIAVGAVAGAALSSGAPEAAAPFKALFAAGAGLALARLIPLGSIVYALAIVVAIADAVSVSVGPTHYLVTEEPGVVDYLALSIPSWGGDISQLGVSDLLFCAVYLSTAWRFGLRRTATAIAIAASLVASLAIAIWSDVAIPALPLMSLALLAPNADLVWAALREDLRKLE